MVFPIHGMGTSVPEHTMDLSEAVELARSICRGGERQDRVLEVLYRRAGVQQRHTVLPHRIALTWLDEDDDLPVATTTGLGPTTEERTRFYEEHAAPLAIEAARAALDDAACSAADLTHLITVSCTGFSTPGVDVQLMTALRMKSTVERVHVGFMGCHGAINGMRVAKGLASDKQARIMVCAVELCSLHYCFRWDPERFIGNALFADGAAAMVGGGSNSGLWNVRATGSCLLPDSTDAMTWRVGDSGFEMTLSPRVPHIILENLKPWLTEWLAGHGLKIDDIRSWAVHPGGPRILAAVEEALGLGPEDIAISRELLAEHGNMSSPTVMFILDRLRRIGAEGPCLALGFGPGLVAEAALLDAPR